MSVRRADPAVRHALDEGLERDVDVEGAVDATVLGLERDIERHGLDLRPREPVEDRAIQRVGRVQAVQEDPDDRLVRDQLATAHVAVRLAPERRPRRDGGAEQVAGRQHRDPESSGECRGLGALAGTGSPQQDDDHHGRGRRTPSAPRMARAMARAVIG